MRIRIGSFNLHKMGKYKTKEDLKKIAEIISGEKMDIISLQEIYSEGKGVEFCLGFLPKGWEYAFDKSKNSKEGYAFLWNGNRFKYSTHITSTGPRVSFPRILNSIGTDVKADIYKLERPPFYARFIPVHGEFIEIRIINAHIFHGGNDSADKIEKRKIEYSVLVNQILPGLDVDRTPGNNRVAYTIAMGDYNLQLKISAGLIKTLINENKPYIDEEEVTVDGDRFCTVQHQLTTLKKKYDINDPDEGFLNNYDHFSFNVSSIERRGNSCVYHRINAIKEYCQNDFEMYQSRISDHVPIVIELNTGGY